MKNITFSAQEDAIIRARKVAARSHLTLNQMFREWLEDINLQTKDDSISVKLKSLWKKTNYLQVGKKLSREEMNKR